MDSAVLVPREHLQLAAAEKAALQAEVKELRVQLVGQAFFETMRSRKELAMLRSELVMWKRQRHDAVVNWRTSSSDDADAELLARIPDDEWNL